MPSTARDAPAVTFLRTGLDGLFTDQPDIGVLARRLAFAPAPV
jgi:glycerophosphoryl diester phosphodiesterase